MSTTIKETTNLSYTQFYGGDVRGVCMQITSSNNYVQFTVKEVKEAIDILSTWEKDDG
jgi:hypothetical protein